MATTYYRFRLDGQLTGLVRQEVRPRKGTLYAYVADGEWVADGSLLRWFIDPGDVELVKVGEADARLAAEEYGVALDAAPARTEPLDPSEIS